MGNGIDWKEKKTEMHTIATKRKWMVRKYRNGIERQETDSEILHMA